MTPELLKQRRRSLVVGVCGIALGVPLLLDVGPTWPITLQLTASAIHIWLYAR